VVPKSIEKGGMEITIPNYISIGTAEARGMFLEKPLKTPKTARLEKPAFEVVTRKGKTKTTETISSSGKSLGKVTEHLTYKRAPPTSEGIPLVEKQRIVKPTETIESACPVVGLKRIEKPPARVASPKEPSPKGTNYNIMAETLPSIGESLMRIQKIPIQEHIPFERVPILVPRAGPKIFEIPTAQPQVRSPRLVQLQSQKSLFGVSPIYKPLLKTTGSIGTLPPSIGVIPFTPPLLPFGFPSRPRKTTKEVQRKRKGYYWEVYHHIPKLHEVLKIKI
jgi:hypothetical protein